MHFSFELSPGKLKWSSSWLHYVFPGQTTDEGSTISCVIERMRGSLDHVYVGYNVSQLDSPDDELSVHQDFVNATGEVHFLPGQRSEVCVALYAWKWLSTWTYSVIINGGGESFLTLSRFTHCTVPQWIKAGVILSIKCQHVAVTQTASVFFFFYTDVFERAAPPSGWLSRQQCNKCRRVFKLALRNIHVIGIVPYQIEDMVAFVID